MATSRERLLNSATTLALAGDHETLRRSLPVDVVCKHAGLSRRTFYDQFPSGVEFNRAVIAELQQSTATSDFNLTQAIGAANDLTDLAAVIGAHLTPGSNAKLRAGFWVDPDDTPDDVVAALLSMVEDSGFIPVHPLTFAEIQGLLTWIIAGIGTRWAVPNIEIGAKAIAAFLSSAVVRVDHADEYRSTILFAELRASALQPTVGLVANLRRLVVDAALAVIAERGLSATRLEDIALEVGISASAIASSLGTVPDLAATGVSEISYALIPPLATDVDAKLAHRELFERHTERVADLFDQQRVVAEIVVLRDLAGDSRPLDSLVTATDLLIEHTNLNRLYVGQTIMLCAVTALRGDSIPPEVLWQLVSTQNP